MMYLGRLTFLLKGGEPHGRAGDFIVSAAEARRQTLAAVMLTEAVAKAALDEGLKASDIWTRIYDVTSFMVGAADDIGYEEYVQVLSTPAAFKVSALPKGLLPAADLVNGQNFFLFKKQLALLAPPAIYSGTGNLLVTDPTILAGAADEKELDRLLAKAMGFRLFGQRFVPDAYWTGRLVFPTVNAPTVKKEPPPFTFGPTGGGAGGRVFPRGLDVAALLGSKRAAALMAETGDSAYQDYDKTFAKLQGELAVLKDADWNANLYWSWLYCLKPLLAEFGRGYPTYMQGRPWQEKELVTALGSWSQLRRDTILYVKQPYGPAGAGPPPVPAERPGYVEPVPEFYARLLALCRLTKDRMTAMKCLDQQMAARLDSTEKLLARLLEISKRELQNEVLERGDYDFIRDFGWQLKQAAVGQTFEEDQSKTSLAADVYTDANSMKALEEATGELTLLVVVNLLPDGKLYASCGPMFTQYEFKQPAAERLTDEAWRKMLADGRGRYDLLPDWLRRGLAAHWNVESR